MFLVENLPKNSTWTVSVICRFQVQMITLAIILWGNVKTVVKYTIYYDKDILSTNEMLVKRVVNIADAIGRKIASVEEAKEILSL